jgi:hypothetical protein
LPELEELRRDSKWLAKAFDAVAALWRKRNKYQSPLPTNESQGRGNF